MNPLSVFFSYAFNNTCEFNLNGKYYRVKCSRKKPSTVSIMSIDDDEVFFRFDRFEPVESVESVCLGVLVQLCFMLKKQEIVCLNFNPIHFNLSFNGREYDVSNKHELAIAMEKMK